MIWDIIVRWRTAILAFLLSAASVLPALLNAPEILAIIPEGWRPYVIAGGFIALYITRWRPATRADDPEVQVAKAISETPGPTTVVVEDGNGMNRAIIRA